VAGTAGGTYASLVGDRAKEAEYQSQHDVGKTKQRSAELDIQRQADQSRS
jgi:hypothetical protein